MTIARGLTTFFCSFPWHWVRHRPTCFDYGRNGYGKKEFGCFKAFRDKTMERINFKTIHTQCSLPNANMWSSIERFNQQFDWITVVTEEFPEKTEWMLFCRMCQEFDRPQNWLISNYSCTLSSFLEYYLCLWTKTLIYERIEHLIKFRRQGKILYNLSLFGKYNHFWFRIQVFMCILI